MSAQVAEGESVLQAAGPGPAVSRSSARALWIFPTVLGLVLVLAAGLRFFDLGHKSFWLDEVFTVESTMGRGFAHRLLPTNTLIDPAPSFTDPSRAEPWWKIWPACRGKAGDLHPPLPYILLRWWCDVFGFSDVAVRSFSVAASLAGIVLLFLIGRQLHGDGVALWAALLMAVAAPQILYAQEAKHYALLQAFSLAACLAVVRIEKKGGAPLRFAALGLMVLALLFTHYLSVAVIGALGLYSLLRLRGRDRWRAVICFLVAATCFLILWGPTMLAQSRDAAAEADFFRDDKPGFVLRELRELVAIPYRLLNEPLPDAEWATYATGVACLLPLLMLRRRPDLLLWAIWLPSVILLVLLLDLARRTWLLALIRYTLVAGPAIYLVLAALCSHMRPSRRHILPALCVASCLLSLPEVYSQTKSDVRGMGREIAANARPGEVTVFRSLARPRQDVFHYFITTSHYARPMPGPIVLLDRPADAALVNQLRARGRAWMVGDSDEIKKDLPGAEVISSRYFPFTGFVLCVSWPEPSGRQCAPTSTASSPSTAR